MEFRMVVMCWISLTSYYSWIPAAGGEANSSVGSSKFLSLFSIVRFSNTACAGTNGYNGTCYTSPECTSHGGKASGTCASGFGVCCIVAINKCGSSTALNSTYWQNPGYGSSYSTAGQCSLYVTKCSTDICQLRLDFIDFDLAQPDATSTSSAGQCLTDIFLVGGQSNPVPTLCGTNTNQHIYVDITPYQNSVTLSMILSGSATERKWNIRISQIPCGTSYTAPDGCLQYFFEPTGTIMSFNYLSATTPLVQHLANQDYTICIRRNEGFCGVGYSPCSNTGGEPAFALSGTGLDGSTASTTSLTDENCVTDWLSIPCASDLVNSAYLSTSTSANLAGCVNKLCGIHFSTVDGQPSDGSVYSYTMPFELRFHTDSAEQSASVANGVITGDAESYGFCLSYTQRTCTIVRG